MTSSSSPLAPEQLQALFEMQAGGQFVTAATEIKQRLQHIKAFVFDWDGVFNNGSKLGEAGSGFSEADSMATNLLRFAYWLEHNLLPKTIIVTGERNPGAIALAQREHFDAIYFKTRNKLAALEHIQASLDLQPKQIAFCFDDVLDLPIAKNCALRFLIQRTSSVMFKRYTAEHDLADYISGHSGDNHAVREICELLIALYGRYDEVVNLRSQFDNIYIDYLQQRNNQITQQYCYNEQAATIDSAE